MLMLFLMTSRKWLVINMITIKSAREIECMREAGRIVALTHKELQKHLKPGISTLELDEIAEKTIRSYGATPSFKGYGGFPGSICASINEVVVHGIPRKNIILKDGDIIALDIGACFKGYHGDSAWSYGVGNISDEAKQLLEVTEKALFEGLSKVKPGNRLTDISHAIEEFVKPYGYGIVEDYTGHGVGSHLHEDPMIPHYGPAGYGPVLKQGMTIAVEPMINLGTKRVKVLKDNWTAVTLDKKISAHFEHTVLITEDGYEILTTLNKEEK